MTKKKADDNALLKLFLDRAEDTNAILRRDLPKIKDAYVQALPTGVTPDPSKFDTFFNQNTDDLEMLRKTVKRKIKKSKKSTKK